MRFFDWYWNTLLPIPLTWLEDKFGGTLPVPWGIHIYKAGVTLLLFLSLYEIYYQLRRFLRNRRLAREEQQMAQAASPQEIQHSLRTLKKTKQYDRLAEAYTAMHQHRRAARAYIKAGALRHAGMAYARAGASLKAARLLEQAGDYGVAAQFFMEKNKPKEAAHAFLQAGKTAEAAACLLEAGQFNDAAKQYIAYFQQPRPSSSRLATAKSCQAFLHSPQSGHLSPKLREQLKELTMHCLREFT